jgi:2,3-bisphosphoglycerate-independent phosphoglycerate mutase
VPCIVYDPDYRGEYSVVKPALDLSSSLGAEYRRHSEARLNEGALNQGLGISSIAATCIHLLGYLPPEDYDKSVLIL